MQKLKNVHLSLTKLYLLHTNPIFRKLILNKYKNVMNYINTNNQTGGTLKILYNNEIFKWYEIEENIWVLYDKYNNDCVSISIDNDSKEVYINNINADTVKCGETILNNQGSHLFKITLQFIKENKTKFNINKIKLKDNAMKNCQNNERINLRIFLTLLTGNTWYGKYGFRPDNLNYRKLYKNNKEIMNTIKLNDVDFNKILEKLLKYKNKNLITNQQYNYFIKVYNKIKDINPLVKELLFIIFRKDKYEFMCSVFNLIYNKLILLLKLKREYLDVSNVYTLDI